MTQTLRLVAFVGVPPSLGQFGLAVTGVGCVATAIALGFILAAKFAEGAWIVVLLISLMFVLFKGIHRHYRRVAYETRCNRPHSVTPEPPPLVIVPVQRWSTITERAMRFALMFGTEVSAVHISHDAEATERLKEDWLRCVEAPLSLLEARCRP